MRALLYFVMLLLRCVPALLRSRREQAIAELALRQQLGTYALQAIEAPAHSARSQLLDCAVQLLASLGALVIVKPDTVVRWHRKGFRLLRSQLTNST